MKEGQKSIRVIMATELYEALKLECELCNSDVSKLIRQLIKKHLFNLGKLSINNEPIIQ